MKNAETLKHHFRWEIIQICSNVNTCANRNVEPDEVTQNYSLSLHPEYSGGSDDGTTQKFSHFNDKELDVSITNTMINMTFPLTMSYYKKSIK